MAEEPIQILEVRGPGDGRPVTVTAAVTADAAEAISVALSEQLDRRRYRANESAAEIVALRAHAELVERFAPLARAHRGAIVQLSDEEFRACLLDLSDYRERVDGEHYQAPELRDRIQLTAQIMAILWDTNGAVAAAGDQLQSIELS